MKHLKNSLIVFAGALVVTGVITFFIPSLTKGMSNDVPKHAFSVVTNGTVPLSGPDPGVTSYAITSLTVSNHSSNSVSASVFPLSHATTDCLAGEPGVGPSVRVAGGETVHLSFPQPFVLSTKPSATSCLLSTWTGGAASLEFAVVGYRF